MKLSASITLWLSLVFALICLGYAVYGWIEIGSMPNGTARDDAQGFVYFYVFLGTIGLVLAAVSWWMVRTDEP